MPEAVLWCSRCIVDETQHANMALELGAAELPLPVKLAMQFSAKVMTRTAYWV